MSIENKKEQDIVSRKAAIWFGCEDCKQQWMQDDQPKDSVFYCGETCPNCQSNRIVVI